MHPRQAGNRTQRDSGRAARYAGRKTVHDWGAIEEETAKIEAVVSQNLTSIRNIFDQDVKEREWQAAILVEL